MCRFHGSIKGGIRKVENSSLNFTVCGMSNLIKRDVPVRMSGTVFIRVLHKRRLETESPLELAAFHAWAAGRHGQLGVGGRPRGARRQHGGSLNSFQRGVLQGPCRVTDRSLLPTEKQQKNESGVKQ